MNQSYRLLAFLFLGLMVISVTTFSSCDNDDDDEGSSLVELRSFGPSPALRGGELRIIGRNLDRVTAVVLTDNINVSSFTSHTPELITLTIPEETVDGKITLKTTEGDITSLSILTISEPIELTSFSPEVVRPGDLLTIEGDYLNLINSVIFTDDVVVEADDFTSQSREQIEVAVPATAQTGSITLSNGEAIPILVESETDLEVKLPRATGLSPNPVKAGTFLTISGTDLDLAETVTFPGVDPVNDFQSQSESSLVVFVPANAQDGKVKLSAASLVETETEEDLIMLVPTINNLSPNPVKNGQTLTVTGLDLDLITGVTFAGDVTASINDGGSDTEVTITVPLEAIDGNVSFHTAANKTVSSADALTMVVPTISNVMPTDVQFGSEITITGTDLDLVTHVNFTGDVSADVNMAMPDMATVSVPVGTQSGPITVVTTNGTSVASMTELNVLVSTNAVITDMPMMAAPGDMISIIGESLDELNEVIFPGEVPATMFGQKTATLIEVFVPLSTALGVGNIKFITFDGEEFFSPEINIQGVDPVDDPSLVFFDFDALGLWWGNGVIENDPALTLDGSNYCRVQGVVFRLDRHVLA